MEEVNLLNEKVKNEQGQIAVASKLMLMRGGSRGDGDRRRKMRRKLLGPPFFVLVR
jgi:hypothetical protein